MYLDETGIIFCLLKALGTINGIHKNKVTKESSQLRSPPEDMRNIQSHNGTVQ